VRSQLPCFQLQKFVTANRDIAQKYGLHYHYLVFMLILLITHTSGEVHFMGKMGDCASGTMKNNDSKGEACDD